MRHVDRADDGLDGTFEKSAIFFLVALGIGRRAAEQDVGLDADLAHLLHGVLGRLRLQLAGGLDVRHERDVDADRVVRVRASIFSWRMASRKGRDSMSPTVPPISMMATSTAAVASRTRALISSVMCGMTWTVAPRYSPRRSFEMTAS